jgi:hypothetical protein
LVAIELNQASKETVTPNCKPMLISASATIGFRQAIASPGPGFSFPTKKRIRHFLPAIHLYCLVHPSLGLAGSRRELRTLSEPLVEPLVATPNAVVGCEKRKGETNGNAHRRVAGNLQQQRSLDQRRPLLRAHRPGLRHVVCVC